VLAPARSVYSGRPWDYVVQRVSAEGKAQHARLPTGSGSHKVQEVDVFFSK
jgi:hypothetical protein